MNSPSVQHELVNVSDAILSQRNIVGFLVICLSCELMFHPIVNRKAWQFCVCMCIHRGCGSRSDNSKNEKGGACECMCFFDCCHVHVCVRDREEENV